MGFADDYGQPAQEPMAWMDENNHVFEKESDIHDSGSKIPLYTHPASSWQELTDEEIYKCQHPEYPDIMYFARAIEQALRNKNGY